MNKKVIGMLLATTVITAVPMNASFAQDQASYQVAVNMSDLIDVPQDHWAYDAVRVLVEELEVMMPKTSNMFKGQDLMTRYELAEVFYRATKKMEDISGKDLTVISDVPATEMVDVEADKQSVVNAVVNEYGIMQSMPGKRFMGNEPISRYEVAFELYNYFVLIESQGTQPVLTRRDRADELTDLPADHWATKAVREIVDKYQIMDGYPNETFQGGKRLTRYETAAVVREFIRYVDTYLLPLTPGETPAPTPMPTAMPTPRPTPMPTPIPEPTKVPFKPVDLRIGGDFKTSYTDAAQTTAGYLYGPNASLDWYFLPIGPTRLGIDLHGDMMFYDPLINPGSFKADKVDANGQPFQTTLNSRATAGGGLVWRLLGGESAQDFGLSLGVGYDYMQLTGVNYAYSNHGPRGRLDIEIPIGSAFSIVGRNAFTYFIAPTAGVPDNFMWKNDGFLGVSIPAYGVFALELGYKDTRYMLSGDNTLFGDIGGEANLRFRF
ncbi:MAG: S-layer homology domain-containing protein [Candidatus Sericytochromatia bacterium]